MSSGSRRIGRWAYDPTSMSLPFWRSYMFVSTSRTIGKAISPGVSSKRGIGPTLIIWCTAGVSGIVAPAMCAMRGLQIPQATNTCSASIEPFAVWTRRTRLCSTSMPVTSVPARTLAPRSCAQGIDDGDARRVEAAEDDVRVDEGDLLDHLLGRQQLASLLAPGERR